MTRPLTSDPIAAPAPGHLLRVLGPVFGLAAGVGTAVGMGILRVPALSAAQLPDPLWLGAAWLAATVWVFVHANTYAELSTLLPEVGGPLVYTGRAFGGFAGFVTGWTDGLIYVAGIAAAAVTIADFLPGLWPGAAVAHDAVAGGLVVAFGLLHAAGVREGRAAQIALSVVKVVGFAAIVGVCLWAGLSDTAPAAPSAAGRALPFAAFLTAWLLVKETFGGYHVALYFAEENPDPGRTVPRAIFGSAGVVSALYLTAVAAVVLVLGMERLGASTLPLADAAEVVLGGAAGQTVMVVALLSLLGLLNAHVMIAPRILYALARHGDFARSAATVSASGTPRAALAVAVGLALPLALTGTFEQIFLLTAVLGLAIDGAVGAALFVLRRREPERARPYRARGYPWVPALVVVVPVAVVAGAFVAQPATSALALGLVALAFPIYRLMRRQARPAVPTS